VNDMERRRFLKAAACLPLLLLSPAGASEAPQAKAKPAGRRALVLLEAPVAGYRYYDGERVWDCLRPGDPLELKREPMNPFDARAIALYWKSFKLGYIPRADNTVLANFLDAGFRLDAGIAAKKPGVQPRERLVVRVSLDEA
jgi:hypothetical protein